MKLLAGVSETSITPPVGVDLSGYAARPGPSIGLQSELYGRAVVFDDGMTRVALLTLDLLGTDLELDAAIREAISHATGISPSHLLINCSHTHAGPSTTDLDRRVSANHAYLTTLPPCLAAMAAEAVAHLVPSTVRWGSVPARIGINRRERTAEGSITIGRNPEGLVDRELRALWVETDKSQVLAVLFQYACHGTTLGGENLRISSDWMGAASRQLAQHFGAPALFLQGCAGQTNPDRAGRSEEEVARLGAAASEAVIAAAEKATAFTATPLRAKFQRVYLPLQDPPNVEVARAELEHAKANVKNAQQEGASPYWVRALGSLVRYAEIVVTKAERGETNLTLPFAVQAVAIGELAIVGLSGEVFLEFAHRIAAQSPFSHTWVLGYTNGCECYVPTAEAFAEGGYESTDSFRWYGTLPLAPQAGDVMATAAVQLLHEVKG